MAHPLEFLLGLLDAREPAFVDRDDLSGPHQAILRHAQVLRWLATEPEMNPVPSCPHCLAGTPYRVWDRYVCSRCQSRIELAALQLWRLDHEGFARWLAAALHLDADAIRVAPGLWRLGMFHREVVRTECFYLRGEDLPDVGLHRLLVFRSALVLHGQPVQPCLPGFAGPVLSLTDLLRFDGSRLSVVPLSVLLSPGGPVRFDPATGELHAGSLFLGRVPPGTREHALLVGLAAQPGRPVAYSDLKRFVCDLSRSADTTEEATFCHKLRWRIKRMHGVEAIDRLIETDRAVGGYRLRAELRLTGAE